jgi:hypothetical protein
MITFAATAAWAALRWTEYVPRYGTDFIAVTLVAASFGPKTSTEKLDVCFIETISRTSELDERSSTNWVRARSAQRQGLPIVGRRLLSSCRTLYDHIYQTRNGYS